MDFNIPNSTNSLLNWKPTGSLAGTPTNSASITEGQNWLQKWLSDPANQKLALQGSLGLAGNLLTARGQQQQLESQLGANQATTEAGFYGDTREEDLTRLQQGAAMMQQDPFTQQNARFKQAIKAALAQGENVGYDFNRSAKIPGMEYMGNIPRLNLNVGSMAKALQTPANIAGEDANWQEMIKQIAPSAPTSDLTSLYGAQIGTPLMQRILQSGEASQQKISASRAAQLAAIKKMLAQGSQKSGGSGAQGALAGAGTGASIGTAFMPGIGTGVGAGLGALIGWLSNR